MEERASLQGRSPQLPVFHRQASHDTSHAEGRAERILQQEQPSTSSGKVPEVLVAHVIGGGQPTLDENEPVEIEQRVGGRDSPTQFADTAVQRKALRFPGCVDCDTLGLPSRKLLLQHEPVWVRVATTQVCSERPSGP